MIRAGSLCRMLGKGRRSLVVLGGEGRWSQFVELRLGHDVWIMVVRTLLRGRKGVPRRCLGCVWIQRIGAGALWPEKCPRSLAIPHGGLGLLAQAGKSGAELCHTALSKPIKVVRELLHLLRSGPGTGLGWRSEGAGMGRRSGWHHAWAVGQLRWVPTWLEGLASARLIRQCVGKNALCGMVCVVGRGIAMGPGSVWVIDF